MKSIKRVIVTTIRIAEVLLLMGGMTACAVKGSDTVPQQETQRANETQQETPASNEVQQTTEQSDITQQNAKQPDQSGNEQISLDEAKNIALTDAGLSASDVIYTKEKLDYEDGAAVYEIAFYAGNTAYEYEVNAATSAIYSKDVDMHHNEMVHGHHDGISQADVSAEEAKTIALNHAGFSDEDVVFVQSEFDFDNGQAVYEVEFTKDGKEYEYTINAQDGTVIAYEID